MFFIVACGCFYWIVGLEQSNNFRASNQLEWRGNNVWQLKIRHFVLAVQATYRNTTGFAKFLCFETYTVHSFAVQAACDFQRRFVSQLQRSAQVKGVGFTAYIRLKGFRI